MKRLALTALALASPTLLVALLIGGDLGIWLFVLTAPLVPVGLMALAGGPPARRRLRAAWLAVWLVALEGGSLALVLADRGAWAGRSFAGLPASTVVMLVVLGAIPLALVPLGCAVLYAERPDGRPPRDR